MNKTPILLIALFLISSAYSLPSLQINPVGININAVQGQIITKYINVTNTGNMTLFNLSISLQNNISWSNIPASLGKNQTATITATIQATNMNVNPIASFFYQFNTTATPKQWNVTVSDSFSPITTTTRQGDSVMWTNIANSSRRVTQTSFLFDYTLASNASISFLTNSQGTLGYFENSGYGFGGTIITNSNIIQSNVHNSGLDKTIPITVIASAAQTTANLNIFLNNLTIKYNEAIANALTIQNTGNSTAYNLFLKGKWSNFNQTTYNIFAGQTKFVQFNTIPMIFQTSQTNQSYTLQINLSGSNIPTTSKSMSVFIKYHAFNTSSNSTQNVQIIYITNASYIQALCAKTSGICPTKTINQTIYADIPHKVNLTTGMVEQAFNNYNNWTFSLQRMENSFNSKLLEIKDLLTAMKNDLEVMKTNISQMKQDNKITNDEIHSVKVAKFWTNVIFWIFLILVIIAFVVWYILYQNRERNRGSHAAGAFFG